MGTWEKKLPPDWDENDTTDWIFDLARKLGIPCEYFASCGTSLTGEQGSMGGIVFARVAYSSSFFIVCFARDVGTQATTCFR